MLQRISLLNLGFAVFVAACVALPSPSYAGFQWTPPADMPQAQAPAPDVPSPPPPMPSSSSSSTSSLNGTTAIGGPEVISPIVIEGGKKTATTKSGNIGSYTESRSTSPSPSMSADVAAPASDSDVVHGFAKQVPLAVALRQILPQGYGFSVDQDVDLGILVSFQGGKRWRETLRDALDPAALTIREQGQMVTISRMTNDGPVAAAAPAPTAPVHIPAQQTRTASRDWGNEASPVIISGKTDLNKTDLNKSGKWTAERGDSLHAILENWARRANVEFDWMSEYDYPLQASVSFSGTFEDAVRDLLMGFELAHPQPIAMLHKNPKMGQLVMVVETRGNNYSN